MIRVCSHEFQGRRDHGGKPALHVSGAPAVKKPVANFGFEGIAVPFPAWACGDDIRVTGEAEHRAALTTPGPEVRDLAELQ